MTGGVWPRQLFAVLVEGLPAAFDVEEVARHSGPAVDADRIPKQLAVHDASLIVLDVDALVQMKGDMQAYMRLYAYLSQMIDYGHTGVEKRYWFYRYLTPLLEFDRENVDVDLSQVTLTHHAVRALGNVPMDLGSGEAEPLLPITEAGTGSVQDKDKIALSQIIAKVNALFEGDLTDGDQLSFVRSVKDKLLESDRLRAQARANSEAQFKASPTIDPELLEAAIAAMEAHGDMGAQVVNSARVRAGLKSLLLNNLDLYRELRSETQPERA